MPTPNGLPTEQDLKDASLDVAHLGRVVNSKDASGAPINTSTNRTGGVNKTLDALEAEYQSDIDTFVQTSDQIIADKTNEFNEAIQAAGGVPLGDGQWAAGATFTAYNEYLVYNGLPYKPATSTTLPYTTQGIDPTVAPDLGNVVAFAEVQASDLVTVREDLLGPGTQLYMGSDGVAVKVGDTVPVGTTHLRADIGGNPALVAMSPAASGVVSVIADTSATIGGVGVGLVSLGKEEITITSSQLSIKSAQDLSNISDIVAAVGMKRLRIKFDQVLNISDGVGTFCQLFDTSLDSFIVDGLTVYDTAVYSSNFDICRLFDLDGIDQVEFNNCYGVSTVSDVAADNFNIGLGFVRNKNSKSFHYSGQLYNGYRPIEVWGTDLVTGYSYCQDTRYNATIQKGCGVVRMELVGLRCRRDFYLYGCKGGELSVSGVDTYGHSPIYLTVTEQGEIAEAANLTIKYHQRNSLVRDVTSRLSPIFIGFSTSTGVSGTATARNIDIVYDVVGDYGTVIDHSKLIDSSNPDTLPRSYVLDNISISGSFTSTKEGTTRLINYKDAENWFTGDVVKNYSFGNLTVNTVAPYNFALNLDPLGNALVGDDAITFENFKASQGALFTNMDYGRKVRFKHGCELRDFESNPSNQFTRSAACKDDYAIIPSGQEGIDLIKMDAERSNNHIEMICSAYTEPESLNSSVTISVYGQVTYNAGGSASQHITLTKVAENSAGTVVNPVITSADSTGVVTLTFPEWLDDSVRVRVRMRVDYEPYTNKYNTYTYGLKSKEYEFLF